MSPGSDVDTLFGGFIFNLIGPQPMPCASAGFGVAGLIAIIETRERNAQ
ncbi:hypothetical protein [Ochrobactrum quorumnocens]|nr:MULTISPECIES: hypothetical protein [Brucella]MBD7992779.1 hypothetical protein [Ochrobactrum gallinarum]MCV9909432.1 hypothetical protein [Brucella sp. HL-2]